MAGKPQWTGAIASVSGAITTQKALCAGVWLTSRGNSAPGSFRLLDSNGGTIRAYGKMIKSGNGGGTAGDTVQYTLDPPILFNNRLFISIGGSGTQSAICTVIYRNFA